MEKRIKPYIARDKERYLTRKGNTADLQISAGKSFLIDFTAKIYTENSNSLPPATASGETLNDFLTTEWLNQKTGVKYEKLSPENGLSRFRVKFENSESVIFIDDNFKIPVKQEFYSVDNENKNLVYSMELRNIKLIAEDSLFEIPQDFRKVTLEEFRKNE